MAVTSLKRSGLTSLIKYDSFLAGNHESVFQLIQSITVGSGGASSVTFSNIPQTFTHLQVRITNSASGSNSSNLSAQFNGDTGSNYVFHVLTGNGTSAASSATLSTTRVIAGQSIIGQQSSSVVDILDYTSTAKNKTVRTIFGWDGNGSGMVGLVSGLWLSTSAITSIVVLPDASSIAQHSTFSLYALR